MQVKSAIYIGERVEIHREEEVNCEVEMVINVSGKRKDNDFLPIRKQLTFIRFPFFCNLSTLDTFKFNFSSIYEGFKTAKMHKIDIIIFELSCIRSWKLYAFEMRVLTIVGWWVAITASTITNTTIWMKRAS